MADLPLTAGDLAYTRAVIEDVTLAGTAVILSATKTADGRGGYTHTYTASGTVACHLAPEQLRGGEPAVAGRIAERTPWILTVAHDATVDEDDRVQVDGVTFEVLEVLAPRTWQLARRVRLMEVD